MRKGLLSERAVWSDVFRKKKKDTAFASELLKAAHAETEKVLLMRLGCLGGLFFF